jgi:hypothetical protein
VSGSRRKVPLFCVATALVGACQRSAPPCEELARVSPKVPLSTDDQRCSELLAFASVASERYGMTFENWLDDVAAQRTNLLLETIYSLTERTTWSPSTFAREPAQIPCGTGFEVTDAYWATSILATILPTRPMRLYASLAVTIPSTPGNVATIEVIQDFDCDGTEATMRAEGEFKQGTSAFLGGWKLLESSYPDVDE